MGVEGLNKCTAVNFCVTKFVRICIVDAQNAVQIQREAINVRLPWTSEAS